MNNTPEKSGAYKNKRSFVRQNLNAIAGTIREPLVFLDNNLEILSFNSKFAQMTGLKDIEINNRLIYEIADERWNTSDLKDLLEVVFPEKMNINDFLIQGGTGKNRDQSFLVNASRFSLDDGDKKIILLTFKEIDRSHNTGDKNNFHLKNFKNILAHAPAMICILRGPEFVFEVANDKYYQLVGNREVIGKPVRKAIPEAEGQGFFELLEEVYKTGKPFIGNEVPIKLNVGENISKNSFLDFVYQPTFDSAENVDGVFVYVVDVTEKVRIRKKLEEKEKYLESHIESIPAMIWITDPEGKSTYLNKNWYEYTGQSPTTAEKFGWLDALHPEDAKAAGEEFIKANDKREPYSYTFRLRNKNGTYRWVIDKGRPKYDAEGNYEGMVGTVVDVHEEKIKEQLIAEKEHRLRSIVEEAPIATAVYTGIQMKIEFANDAMIELWGKDRSVRGITLLEALPELEGQPFKELLEEVFRTGKTYWGKEQIVDLLIDNKMQRGFFNFSYTPLRNEDGEIYGILNMAQDVSQMVESKTLLKESETYYRQMTDLMPGKIINTDEKGNLTYFNEHWLEYTGRNKEELKSQGWIRFIHPKQQKKFAKNWNRSLESGEDFEMEIRLLNKNNKYKWHISRAEAVKDEAGKIKMWICTNTEIQKLKEEEKRKGDFLKMVSHELKTPVTSIKGYVQLLLSMLSNRDEKEISSLPLKPSLERIDHQIKRLTRLISEMLDLSRIEENKLELKKETFNLNDLITETVQDINYTNTQHQIEVFHRFRCKVHADKDRIGQVLINFVTNAIKYSPDNQKIEVTVDKEKNGQVSVSVKDQGMGIEKKYHKSIFKRFYRVGVKSEETYSGFGIGLFLAKEIISRHKGAILVKSRKGKGSEFIFTLNVDSVDSKQN